MKFWKTALRGVPFHAYIHLGVVLGTATAAAVLVGALLVGDSMDHTLRRLASLRLGEIGWAADTRPHFFPSGLADRLADGADVPVAPALALPGMILHEEGADRPHPGRLQARIMGVTPVFWRFGRSAGPQLGEGEAALGRHLAERLGVEAGAMLSLRVSRPARLARDAPLASRGEDLSLRLRVRVVAVLDDEAMGRFDLLPSQIPPPNVFVSLSWLHARLGLGSQANLLLAGGGDGEEAEDRLRSALRNAWALEDGGWEVTEPIPGILQLTSDRLFLNEASAAAAQRLPGSSGVLTYLVNEIRNLEQPEQATPYSFVNALSTGPADSGEDFAASSEILRDMLKVMGDDGIILNAWTADQLRARPGSRVRVSYSYLLPSNRFEERAREFTVRAVLPMEAFEGERALMPVFPGLSDVESCRAWDIGLPMEEELLADAANEAYWQEYRDTPKALVTLAAGQAMWPMRFGPLTAVRFPARQRSPEEASAELARHIGPSQAGLVFRSVRREAREAVAGAQDFGQLFLGLSMFLLAAALLLTVLLFALGIDRRHAEAGLLRAVGFPRGRLVQWYAVETAAIAALGCVAGGALGMLYTRGLLWGLARVWQASVAGTPVLFHAQPLTIAVGAGLAWLAAMLATGWTVRRHARIAPQALLRGVPEGRGVEAPGNRPAGGRKSAWAAAGCLAGSVLIVVRWGAPQSVAAFFAAGTGLLAAGLFAAAALARYGVGRHWRPAPLTRGRLVFQGVARRAGRGLLVVGLLACGSFLVLAVSAMKDDPGQRAGRRDSGAGGFALIAETSLPLLHDFGTAEGRARLGLPADVPWDDMRVVPLRVRDGEDAGCLNLHRAQAPRILGVDPDRLAAVDAFVAPRRADPWQVLRLARRDTDDFFPALAGDTDTATWGLGIPVGHGYASELEYLDGQGRPARVRLVGALPMRISLFQGTLLMDEADFTRLFPSEEGHRLFLIEAPTDRMEPVRAALEEGLARFGFEAVSAADRLRAYHAVEATYLNVFLVLGGLGLLLGSVGMALVVYRHVLERQAEWALLLAVGFTRRRAAHLVLAENALLLSAGLVIGPAAAAVAVWPAMAAAAAVAPWPRMLAMVLGMGLLGLASATAAARLAFRAPLVDALRND